VIDNVSKIILSFSLWPIFGYFTLKMIDLRTLRDSVIYIKFLTLKANIIHFNQSLIDKTYDLPSIKAFVTNLIFSYELVDCLLSSNILIESTNILAKFYLKARFCFSKNVMPLNHTQLLFYTLWFFVKLQSTSRK